MDLDANLAGIFLYNGVPGEFVALDVISAETLASFDALTSFHYLPMRKSLMRLEYSDRRPPSLRSFKEDK